MIILFRTFWNKGTPWSRRNSQVLNIYFFSLINSNKVPTLFKDVHLLNARVQHCTRYFLANGLTNPDIFQPKTFLILREIIPQNFSSLGFAVSEELGNKQKNSLTHSLTDWRFYRVIHSKIYSFTYTHYLHKYKVQAIMGRR